LAGASDLPGDEITGAESVLDCSDGSDVFGDVVPQMLAA
jgi:hypothetical protein